MNKKDLILNAFENLDAPMLDVLLNDEMSYQDVPKDTFVKSLKQHFEKVKSSSEVKLDFKAYKGKCLGCSKGKDVYSFVNSDGDCMQTMLFVESEDDFSDIYVCGSYENKNAEIVEEWCGISFYDDEKTDFMETSETLFQRKRSEIGVSLILNESAENGILEANFYVNWYNEFSPIGSIKNIFDKKNYSFSTEIRHVLATVGYINYCYKKNEMAKQFCSEFYAIPVIEEKTIKDWLRKADKEFNFAKFGLGGNINFLQDYLISNPFKFRLSELYWYQNISEILQKYFEWISEDNENSICNEISSDYDFPY